ncbi:hypothetical protein BDF14DRAFT_1808886 [Spinellus fusiger]|nr:hypothetical protein BDF14DRAFT_1808886 [Spinellus fusiger]
MFCDSLLFLSPTFVLSFLIIIQRITSALLSKKGSRTLLEAKMNHTNSTQLTLGVALLTTLSIASLCLQLTLALTHILHIILHSLV